MPVCLAAAVHDVWLHQGNDTARVVRNVLYPDIQSLLPAAACSISGLLTHPLVDPPPCCRMPHKCAKSLAKEQLP
jgi:hypothetical protein